jgi:hypothetical protein
MTDDVVLAGVHLVKSDPHPMQEKMDTFFGVIIGPVFFHAEPSPL